MKISKAEQAALVDELRRIAFRLASAPAHTEANAKASYQRSDERYPYQVGGLSQICTSSARDIEAIITADEACTNLPPKPRGKYGRTLARLYTLVGKTSGRAQGALERVEELVAARAAQLAAQVAKPARRAR